MALLEKYSSSGNYQRMPHVLRYAIPLLFIANLQAQTAGLQPFTSDGCSMFPNGSSHQEELWLDCCQAHDAAYWAGGTLDQRDNADQTLRACVASKGETTISWLMLAGVNLGGSPFWPTSFRWGFGWPYLRGYQELSATEIRDVQKGWPTNIDLPAYLQPTQEPTP